VVQPITKSMLTVAGKHALHSNTIAPDIVRDTYAAKRAPLILSFLIPN
jgi:hypothetical protein